MRSVAGPFVCPQRYLTSALECFWCITAAKWVSFLRSLMPQKHKTSQLIRLRYVLDSRLSFRPVADAFSPVDWPHLVEQARGRTTGFIGAWARSIATECAG